MILKKYSNIIISNMVKSIILDLMNKNNLSKDTDIFRYVKKTVFEQCLIDEFYMFLYNNLLSIVDIGEGIIPLEKLNQTDLDTYYFIKIMLENFGKLNITKLDNKQYDGALLEQGFIFIEENEKIISICKYDDIIKNVNGEEQFFLTEFYKIEKKEDIINIIK